MPEIYASSRTRDVIAQMVNAGGYEVRLTDGNAALLELPAARRSPSG